jgi:hypothetical protein
VWELGRRNLNRRSPSPRRSLPDELIPSLFRLTVLVSIDQHQLSTSRARHLRLPQNCSDLKAKSERATSRNMASTLTNTSSGGPVATVSVHLRVGPETISHKLHLQWRQFNFFETTEVTDAKDLGSGPAVFRVSYRCLPRFSARLPIQYSSHLTCRV